MKQVKAIILILMVFTIGLSAQIKVEDIQSFTLKNGMKIHIVEDHTIPNVAMYTAFKAGSRNEYPGITGISHFLEHMMFKGAKKYTGFQFDMVMESKGGANNAFTGSDYTCYTDFFPSSEIEQIFDLEGDRLANLAFTTEMLEPERKVIHSEYTTGYENSPDRLLYAQMLAVAYEAHPYRWMVIGYESDILNWRRSDLKNYFDTYYAPNNSVMFIAGDVTLENVKKLAEKYLEPVPSREAPRPVHTKEPEQLGEKRLFVKRDVSSPHILIGYHIPEAASQDMYPLILLESILSSGKSSRLYRSLVSEKQLVTRVFCSASTSLDPALFSFSAICSKDVNEATVEKAIYDEIDKVIQSGVTDEELQKAINRKLVAFYSSLETINGRASALTDYEITYGSYKHLFKEPEFFKKVTKEDIKAVAAKYFLKSNRTVAIMKSKED